MPGSRSEYIRHHALGVGQILLDRATTLVVRFEHGIEECSRADVEKIAGLYQALSEEVWHRPLNVVHRTQAAAIRSVNDSWGVFARSRIELLPHQLWVCRVVNDRWPTHWLVADDVGLGKTIEAGMILSPLLSRGVVKRVLVVAPASLIEQWHYRLRTMFDIRLAIYTTDADTAKSDFWGHHHQVVASMQTLRQDHAGRQQRLLQAEPWDLVMVDEAHHLNADDQHGFTLAYKLLRDLRDAGKVRSSVFFTGTPHRGKNFGFLALLQLLRPDLFDPKLPLQGQLHRLPEVMIRNCKTNVTDLSGKRLFLPSKVTAETYEYSPAEQRFYDLLTQFIAAGWAYATGLTTSERSTNILVLITMQKLASSSPAAIRRALQRRLGGVQKGQSRLEELQSLVSTYRRGEDEGPDDATNALEEEIAELASSVQLMRDEEPRLRSLLAAAEAIAVDTKLSRLMTLVQQRFKDRSVLFFTEYKATQAALVSLLLREYGGSAVTFINGDERLDDVVGQDGAVRTINEHRGDAAEKFNAGTARFLVPTEAAGEGIDLQAHCHTLVHVDLPWNPMRLHQRVGRLNRYGQLEQVEVLTIRNPSTVEALIWDKLNAKLETITVALSQVMDEPEDLLQLVLGMTSNTMFTELFSAATQIPRERLSTWFDHETAKIGGADALEAVRMLVGNAKRFDFQQASGRIPAVDLPDLRPFLENSLALNGRKLREEGDGSVTFLLPDEWRGDPAVRAEYRGMLLSRSSDGRDSAERVLGVGHKVIDIAITRAVASDACLAGVPSSSLDWPLVIVRITDRVTTRNSSVRAIIGGVLVADGESQIMRDWEILKWLNSLPVRKAAFAAANQGPALGTVEVTIDRALRTIEARLPDLEHGFQEPEIEVSTLFWPLPLAVD